MSVDVTNYVVYGVKLDFDDVSNDKYEEYMDGQGDDRLRIIRDGMSGEYNVLGIVLAKSDHYNGGFEGFVKIKPTAVEKKLCVSLVNEFLGEDWEDDLLFETLVFTHHS